MNDNTLVSTVLRFKCTKCKRTEFIQALQDPSDGGFLVDEKWKPVMKWLRVYSTAVGLQADIQDTYCPKCAARVIKALGYSSYKTFETMVKANEHSQSHVSMDASSIEDSDVPFYLLDSDKPN